MEAAVELLLLRQRRKRRRKSLRKRRMRYSLSPFQLNFKLPGLHWNPKLSV